MDTDSDGQISVAELIAWVKKNSEQVGLISCTFICKATYSFLFVEKMKTSTAPV